MNNNIAIIINVKQFDEFEIFGTLEPKFVKAFGFTKMQHGCNSISGSSVLWYATLNNIVMLQGYTQRSTVSLVKGQSHALV